MTALRQIAAVAVLLAGLAALPTGLVALRQMGNQMAATIPHHASPLEEAEFWARALGM